MDCKLSNNVDKYVFFVFSDGVVSLNFAEL